MFHDLAIVTVSVACVFLGMSIMLNFATARRHDARIRRLEAEIDRLLAVAVPLSTIMSLNPSHSFKQQLDVGDPGILICDNWMYYDA